MEFAKILISGVISCLTALLTVNFTYRSNSKRWIQEKRSELYLTLYEKMELVLANKEKIFDAAYLEELEKFKPQMHLFSSSRTLAAFMNCYDFINAEVSNYKDFYSKYDPNGDPDKSDFYYDEESQEEIEVPHSATSQELRRFSQSVREYKSDRINDAKKKLNPNIETLYSAMQKDLGGNL